MEETAIDIVKKLLPPEKLQMFEAALTKYVETEVASKTADLVAIKEQELQEKYDTLTDEYVAKELAIKEKQLIASLTESYDKKIATLEEKLSLKVGTFLDSMIAEQVSDKMLEQIAINNTLKPVVEGIRNVFASNHIVLESTASKVVGDLESKMLEMRKEVAKLVKENVNLHTELDKTAKYLIFSENTKNLTESETKMVVKTFIDRPFDEVEKNIGSYITLIKEGKKHVNKPTSKPKMDTMLTEQDHINQNPAQVQDDNYDFGLDAANLWFERNS